MTDIVRPRHFSVTKPGTWIHPALNIIGLVVILHGAWLAWCNTLAAPWFDLWPFVTDLDRFFHGTYRLTDLIAQANEHRIATTRVVLLIDGALFHLTGHFTVVLNFLALLGLGFGCARLFHTRRLRDAGAVPPTLAVMALTCSSSQWFNLISPFQIQFVLTAVSVFGAAAALVAATAPQRTSLAHAGFACVAIVSAFLAAFSMGSGIFALPALLVLLWLRKAPAAMIAGFALMAAAIIAAYLHGFHSIVPLWMVNRFDLFAITGKIVFALGFLGSGLLLPTVWPFLAGAALVGGFAVSSSLVICRSIRIRRAVEGRVAIAIAVGLWILACAAVVATSRWWSGPDSALASRYAMMSSLFAAITIMLTAHQIAAWPWARRRAGQMSTAAVLVFLAGSNLSPQAALQSDGFYRGTLQHAELLRQNVRIGGLVPMDFVKTVDDLVPQIKTLHDHRLAMFAAASKPPRFARRALDRALATAAPACRGAINSLFKIDKSRFAARGWLADPITNITAAWVAVVDQHRQVIAFDDTIDTRTDLAAPLGAAGTHYGFDSGFGGAVPADPDRQLRFWGIMADGTVCVLPGSFAPSPPPPTNVGLQGWAIPAANLARQHGTATDWAAIY